MIRRSFLLLSLLAACSDEPSSSHADAATPRADAAAPDAGQLDVEPSTAFIRDAEGRALVLRGVNVAHTAKRAPDGVPWVDREAVLRLRKEWGLNVIRLTLFWRHVEPERGVYDDDYLAKLEDILDWSKEADIAVVLDMHQDLFGFEATDQNEGDGPPEWARSPDCPPFLDNAPWFGNYFTEPVRCQFDAFWADERGVQGDFAAMWKHVAKRLGNHPAVIGVDLWNEPWITDGHTADELLGPFYDRLIPAVRAEAPDVLVFYEPGTLTGSITDQSCEKPAFDGLVYAPHYYPSTVTFVDEYEPNDRVLAELYRNHQRVAREANVPLWIGELGTGADVKGGEQYFRDVMALWGPDFVGYARWAYDSTRDYDFAILDDDHAPVASFLDTIEPFAERIPGNPRSTSIDVATKTLELALDSDRAGELVISCPPTFCATQRDVTVTKAGDAIEIDAPRYDAELGQLRVSLPQAKDLAVTLRWGSGSAARSGTAM